MVVPRSMETFACMRACEVQASTRARLPMRWPLPALTQNGDKPSQFWLGGGKEKAAAEAAANQSGQHSQAASATGSRNGSSTSVQPPKARAGNASHPGNQP